MTDTAIRVENIGKKYKLGGQKSGSFRESITRWFQKPDQQPITNDPAPTEFWALKEVDFEIKQGEAVGIIGRNGAGKSTLLKILSRITEPTKGRFEVFGRVSSLLEVGTGFHEELTGRENVYLNGTILGMRRAEVRAKFDEIVAFSGVEKFIDTPVKHYSSGMKVRLAFAVAAHLEPEILIIDEVLAVGDAEFQKKCLGKMEDVTHNKGRTVLFVSHNMEAVSSLCQKAIILKNGVKIFDGKSKEGIGKYIALESDNVFHFYKCLKEKSFFKQVEILNYEYINRERILFGEPFSILINFSKMSEIKGLVIVCKIFDTKHRLISVSNTMNNPNLNISKSGDTIISMNVSNNILVPGKYYVEIGAYVRPHTTVEIIENCLAFEISEVSFDENYKYNIVLDPVVNIFEKWELIN